MPTRQPISIINSVAPIRVCDNGGWTDTWFAGHGRIFNIGVYPYAEVQLAVFPDGDQQERIVINAENYGERYVVNPEKQWDKHPLLEAAIAYMRVPKNLSFEVTIYSEAPGGASTGTSAAVTVALIGALDSLTPGRMTPHEVALAAQRIETEMLHQQCGIQDQLCAAYGGINYIEMYQYPHASVSPDRRAQLDLVGVGTAAGVDLSGQVASIVVGARDGHSRTGECRAGLPAVAGFARHRAALARCAVRRRFCGAGCRR